MHSTQSYNREDTRRVKHGKIIGGHYGGSSEKKGALKEAFWASERRAAREHAQDVLKTKYHAVLGVEFDVHDSAQANARGQYHYRGF
jgi:hypothetical protein